MIFESMSAPDVIGYAGVGLILTAYTLLQIGKLTPEKALYSALNGLGAAGILISLYFDPNLPAILMEIAWLIVSLFGLYHAISNQKG